MKVTFKVSLKVTFDSVHFIEIHLPEKENLKNNESFSSQTRETNKRRKLIFEHTWPLRGRHGKFKRSHGYLNIVERLKVSLMNVRLDF